MKNKQFNSMKQLDRIEYMLAYRNLPQYTLSGFLSNSVELVKIWVWFIMFALIVYIALDSTVLLDVLDSFGYLLRITFYVLIGLYIGAIIIRTYLLNKLDKRFLKR